MHIVVCHGVQTIMRIDYFIYSQWKVDPQMTPILIPLNPV